MTFTHYGVQKKRGGRNHRHAQVEKGGKAAQKEKSGEKRRRGLSGIK